jgi:SpoVK/Ycf46/Vps4 family AAA+-type ATPase
MADSADVLAAGAALVAELVAILELRRAGAPEAVTRRAEWEVARDRFWELAWGVHASGSPVPLVEIARDAQLDRTDISIVLAAIAPSVEPDLLDRYVELRRSFFFRGLDVDLALNLLFADPAERVRNAQHLSPGSRLVEQRIVRLRPIAHELHPHEVEVRVCESVANRILGRPPLSGVLAGLAHLGPPAFSLPRVVAAPEIKQRLVAVASGHLQLVPRIGELGYSEVFGQQRGLVLQVAGPSGSGRTALAHGLAHSLGRPICLVRLGRFTGQREAIQPLATEVFREARRTGAILLMDDADAHASPQNPLLSEWLEALDTFDGIAIWVTRPETALDAALHRRVALRVDLEAPTGTQREQLWENHLPPEAELSSDIDVTSLAATYELSGAAIRSAVHLAVAELAQRGATGLTMDELVRAAQSKLHARFDAMALRTPTHATLEQLILPDEQRNELQEILGAMRHHDHVLGRWGFGKILSHGRGIAVLFDGPPGTGKTFCAEIVAAELGLPLFRVAVPQLVSKWVGETERNIAELFTRARASRALLLFDEADSLFGRRTQSAGTANDRYANMEVNQILQELERYDGYSVLTTNLTANLDEALERRIQFRVTFPFPGPEERAKIWDILLPPEAPRSSDLDLEELADCFELAGGHIKNALLRGAYRARDAGRPIAQDDLWESAAAEYRAQGKLVPPRQSAERR